MSKKVWIPLLITVIALGLFASIIVGMKVSRDAFVAERAGFISELKKFIGHENTEVKIERSGETMILIQKGHSVSITINADMTDKKETKTNAQMAADIRKQCIKLLSSGNYSLLSSEITSASRLTVNLTNYDEEYPQLKKDLNADFMNKSLMRNKSGSSYNSGEMFSSLYINGKMEMTELECFSDLSEMEFSSVYAGIDRNYTFDKFTNLKYLRISELNDQANQEDIEAIKAQLSPDCVFEYGLSYSANDLSTYDRYKNGF